jgi:hypothetical protein
MNETSDMSITHDAYMTPAVYKDVCSILKCCISSNNEITHKISKSSMIVERHIAGVVNEQ